MFTFQYMPKQPAKALHKNAKGIRTTYVKAFAHLHYELRRIGATEVVIEHGYRPEQMRLDGKPYADAKPEHRQARLSFKVKGMPLRFFQGGSDEFALNIYLISLTLERLRAVKRYGCTEDDQQYRGFAALPPGRSIVAAEWPSADEAMRWLCRTAGVVEGGALGLLDQVYPQAATRAHPDRGGSNELMAKVNRARDFIRSVM